MNHKFARLIPILLVLLSLIRATQLAEAHPPEQAAGCTTASPGTDPSATVCRSDVIVTTDGVSPDNRFSVSWISSSPETGQVRLVGGDTFGDARGASFSGITHYVQVSNLQSNTAYQFDIISGANTYTNNGQHWSINIGPALAEAAPDPILGGIKKPDGINDADEAIVYATIQRADGSGSSSLLSEEIDQDSAGSFQFHLSDARALPDYSSRFNYDDNTDKLVLTAVGPGGFTSVTVNITVAKPSPGGFKVVLVLGKGFVTYNTPTPTPIPPTSTPTPVTPTVTQTPPPLTATALAATETATAFTSTPALTQVPPSATAPRPTPTLKPPAVPTATAAVITIVPADQTEVAQATLESTQESSPEPPVTRLPPLTATPGASFAFAGIASSGSVFAVLAVVALVGAALLGAAAFFVWKKR